MSNVLSYITGPRLYSAVTPSPDEVTNYSPNLLESIPNYTITIARFCMGIFKWTTLFWAPIMYRRYKNLDGILSVGKLMCYLATGYWSLFAIRGLGRLMNPMYSEFLVVLYRAQKSSTSENMEMLSKYYFDFSHWPVSYDVSTHRNSRLQKSIPKRSTHISTIFRPLSYILAHTIGIRMAFPGCTSLINTLVSAQRIERLIQMSKTHNIKRVKIRTAERNDIEAFYKDNRHSKNPNGKILVICCEGNAGYPELGNPKIPMENDYSVIGWNHPGFGGSTGLPFPKAEQYSIDAVMKFAIDYLHFDVSEIILFGWSIGGYTATWAAMNYPDIRGLILDATFDNIDKLAEKSMPMILYPLVLATVYEYIDLNVGGQMSTYNGPVRFIIRGQDEIITSEPGVKASNRGYFLLVDILKRRYPDLVTKMSLKLIWDYFSASKFSAKSMLDHNVETSFCEDIIKSSIRATGKSRPLYPLIFPGNMTDLNKAQLLLYIASKYVDEFDGAHCTELSPEYFREGWTESELDH